MGFRLYDTAAAFLEAASPWLLEAPDENGPVLSMADYLLRAERTETQAALLGVHFSEGSVQGGVVHLPPHKLGCTTLRSAAVEELVHLLCERGDEVRAVVAPAPTAGQFADAWSAAAAVDAAEVFRQRAYRARLGEGSSRGLDLPGGPAMPRGGAESRPAGGLRFATQDDAELVAEWLVQFGTETDRSTGRPRALADFLIDSRSLVLWDDGGPTSMAGTDPDAVGAERINYVFTPPAYRGRGYAHACLTELLNRLSETRRHPCILYADPDSTAAVQLYRSVGFRPTAVLQEFVFTER